MANSKKQDTNTGSGFTKAPILAGASALTAGELKQSQPLTSIGAGNTKPVSILEALSLLQTLGLDLRGLNCEVSILAKGQMVYFVAKVPASIGQMAMSNGHITANNTPVSVGNDTGKGK